MRIKDAKLLGSPLESIGEVSRQGKNEKEANTNNGRGQDLMVLIEREVRGRGGGGGGGGIIKADMTMSQLLQAEDL